MYCDKVEQALPNYGAFPIWIHLSRYTAPVPSGQFFWSGS